MTFRRSVGGRYARLNLSTRGLSTSLRLGPVTVDSRGRRAVRLGPGLSYRTQRGSRRRQANDAAQPAADAAHAALVRRGFRNIALTVIVAAGVVALRVVLVH